MYSFQRTVLVRSKLHSVFVLQFRFNSKLNARLVDEGLFFLPPPTPSTCASALAAYNEDDIRIINAIVKKADSKLYFSSPENLTKESPSPNNSDKPNADQLQKIAKVLQISLERTFTHPMDYTIYHPDIVFIDNIRNIRTQGIAKYVQHVGMLKIVGHLKFALVRFEILNMSTNFEEGRITIRWRIRGLSGFRVMLKFWKYKLWKWQEMMNHQETWYDGVSYFDVGSDCKIFQHIADKVMEDKDRGIDDKPSGGRNIPLAAKLGALATVFPTPSSLIHGNVSHSSTVAGSPSTL